MAVKYTKKAACNGKKLLIEVTGINHGASHDFGFYDLSDMTEQTALNGKKQIDPQLAESTVYSWDWSAEAENRNVWLKIDGKEGPIKLPLFSDVTLVEREISEQRYLVQAFVPMTLLPTFKKSPKDEERIAPVRDGYLYIAYNGKIWREVKLSSTEAGEPCFEDVDLFTYRSGRDQPFQTNTKRAATGQPLTSIWFPAKANGRRTDVRFAYSEVQWSGARLNRLEAHLDELEARMEKAPSKLESAAKLPEMRARDFELEMLLGEPSSYNRDLSGKWLSNTYKTIKAELDKARDDGDEAVRQFSNHPMNDSHRYELTLKQSALNELLAESVDSQPFAIKSGSDWLGYAKEHKLKGIIVGDSLFVVRHSSNLCKAGVSYLGLVLHDASTQTYFKPAELVQRFLVPKKWGKTENKNHQYIEDRDFDNYHGGRFHRTLRSTERWLCSSIVSDIQKVLSTLLLDERFAIHLKDISSLDDANATAIYPFVGNAISALSLKIDNIDFLAIGEKEHTNSMPIDTLQTLLSNDRSHPLHELLFLQEGEVSLEADYIAPKIGINDGAGLCTLDSMARWADKKLLIDPKQIEVLELNELLPVLKDNGEGTFGTERRIANFADGLFRDFFQAFITVKEAVGQSTTTAFSMNAYVPALGLLKVAGPTALGQLRFVSADKLPSNWYIIGVHGQGLSFGLSDAERQYVTNKSKKTVTGTAYDKNGKLVFTSRKRMVKNSGFGALRKAPIDVVAVPENSALASLYNKPSTKRALNDLEKKGVTLSNVYERFKVPYFIVCVELWNLKSNWQYFKDVTSNKSLDKRLYSAANILSVTVDLSVATAHAGNLCLGAESQLFKVTNVVKEYALLARFSSISPSIQASVSRLAFVGFLGGLLTAGIAAYDTFTLFDHNDDAMVGMAMVSIGVLISTFSSVAVGETLLAAAGPWGFAIAVIGGLLYMWLKDSPIEVWIANGPFSKDPSRDYAHLQDADIAFKRLLNLFLAFEVKIYTIAKDLIISSETRQKMIQTGATHAVLVKSNLSQLLNKDKTTLSLFARQGVMHYTRTRDRTGFGYNEQLMNIDHADTQPLGHLQLDDGDLFFFKLDKIVPKDKDETSFLFSKYTENHYQPALAIRSRLIIDDIIMPCAELDDPSEPLASVTEKPSFTSDEKFWLKSIATEKFSWPSPIVHQ